MYVLALIYQISIHFLFTAIEISIMNHVTSDAWKLSEKILDILCCVLLTNCPSLSHFVRKKLPISHSTGDSLSDDDTGRLISFQKNCSYPRLRIRINYNIFFQKNCIEISLYVCLRPVNSGVGEIISVTLLRDRLLGMIIMLSIKPVRTDLIEWLDALMWIFCLR